MGETTCYTNSNGVTECTQSTVQVSTNPNNLQGWDSFFYYAGIGLSIMLVAMGIVTLLQTWVTHSKVDALTARIESLEEEVED